MAFHGKIDDGFKMTEVICVIERLNRSKDLITRKIATKFITSPQNGEFSAFLKIIRLSAEMGGCRGLSDYQLRWEDAAGNT